jgi:HSP20 family molecular chaperone IbpA
MDIDSVNANSAASQRIKQKRRELEDLENTLTKEKIQAESAGRKEIQAVNEKNSESLVKISKEGERLAEALRTQHRAQIQQVNEQQFDSYQKVAGNAAEQLKLMDEESRNQLLNFKKSAMEKVKSSADKATDPFYRLKSFDATIAEDETSFKIRIKLPAHEAENVYLATEGKQLKLSLARTFGDKAEIEPNHTNRTYSYQTILESFTLPAAVSPKNMTRDYKDGVLTIQLKKA